MAGATTVAGRLVQRFGEAVSTPFAAVSHHFPSPQTIAGLSIDQLAGIGIPGARAATLQHIAQFAIDGGLQRADVCRPGNGLTIDGIGRLGVSSQVDQLSQGLLTNRLNLFAVGHEIYG